MTYKLYLSISWTVWTRRECLLCFRRSPPCPMVMKAEPSYILLELSLIPKELGLRSSDHVFVSLIKRDSIIEKQSSLYITIHHWLNVHPLYHDWLRSWIKKRVKYLSCIEGKGVWKTFDLFHNSARHLFLYYEIYSV